MKLRDQVVFLTDADSPSGKALMRRLADEGASLLLNSDSGGAGIASELQQLHARGTRTYVCNIDLCDHADVSRHLDQAEQQLGGVGVLVHNRKFVAPISVEAGEERLFDAILRANAKSAFICAQAVGARMTTRGTGRIVFVGSIHAEKPTGSTFAYSVAMGAVQMLSREASLALGRFGINVNYIQMGPLPGDDATFHSDISFLYEDYEYKVPNAILGSWDDLAELVVFVAGDGARYLNGADIRLDGGFLNHYLDHKTKKP
jgi:NAD(P)-dependent dehydrogenase (short-subunit alcohol dehydrogenase family)